MKTAANEKKSLKNKAVYYKIEKSESIATGNSAQMAKFRYAIF